MRDMLTRTPLLLSLQFIVGLLFTVGFLAVTACVPVLAATADERAPMGKKVMYSREMGFCVRFPYAWFPGDQYKMEVGDGRERSSFRRFKQQVVNGRRVMVLDLDAEDKTELTGFRAFAATVAATSTASLPDLGDAQVGEKMDWRSLDYYRDPAERPFADPKWALNGIYAYIGTSKTKCALVVQWANRVGGIVMPGKPDSENNKALIDSFEVMSSPTKLKIDDIIAGKAKFVSWREQQARNGNVIDRKGKPVRANGTTPAVWSDAWEVETENYRILGNASTSRMMEHAAYYEGLHRTYRKIFQPDRLPPYKTEVHVFNTCDQFENGARAWIDPSFSARGMGGIIGGFFVPKLVSVWVYEESGKLGGKDFTVEHVSAHECSHQFLHLTCNGTDNVPTWINEGLAVLFENGIFSGGEFGLRPPTERIQYLRDDYRQLKSTLLPLDQYIEHHGHISPGQYGEVYAMTHFWIYGSGKEGLTRLQKYMRELKAGKDGAKAFEDIFMADIIKAKGSREAAIEAWKQALLEYVKSPGILDMTPPKR